MRVRAFFWSNAVTIMPHHCIGFVPQFPQFLTHQRLLSSPLRFALRSKWMSLSGSSPSGSNHCVGERQHDTSLPRLGGCWCRSLVASSSPAQVGVLYVVDEVPFGPVIRVLLDPSAYRSPSGAAHPPTCGPATPETPDPIATTAPTPP